EELNKLAAGGGDTEQTYSINLRSHPHRGKSAVIRETDSQKGIVKTLDDKGKLLGEVNMDQVKELVCRETTLEEGDGRPSRYKETYEKAVSSGQGKSRAENYQGRTMVFELKDGKYVMKPASGPALREEDKETLADRPSKHELDVALMPGKDVKIGN